MPNGIISIRSPFTKELLQSSQRLSASEFDIATQFISIGQQCISYVDAAIARAHSGVELDDLARQREDIVEQVLQHKNAVRSMRRLPPEIVSKFLALTLPYVEDDDFGKTPWHLGHICQYWRDTALASPSLWSDIVIMSAHRYPLGKLATLLARSSNSPLKVLLWSSPFETADSNATEFLQILVHSAPRWTSASLSIKPAHWSLLASIRGRIPLLRYLRIDVAKAYRDNFVSQGQADPFEIAPALRDVALEDLSGLPHAITTPHLEMASLDFTNDPPDTGLPLIRLAHLRRLYVSSQSFLNQLELPALEEIYMVGTHPAPFLSLVERCPAMRLHTLRIVFCTPTHISQILEACPTLQTLGLQITTHDKGNDLLSSLTPSRTGATTPGIGPNVHSIALGIDGAKIKYGLFVSMVESRWRVPAQGPCCRLRSVELLVAKGETAFSKSMEQRLDVLKREGLQMSILQGSEASSELMEWRI
ncbi:hypothetical protein B0H13DRAFT_2276160 [Mycena leptocephala]|nr:hypothetical protein B0H13DRAFT_2276160 [Mycena leptocephala]